MLNIDVDIRTLSKWLNEEQLCEIDRPALARVLGFSQLIIQNYPRKDNPLRDEYCLGDERYYAND